MTTPTAVIVLAAGAGTRMKSSLPKVVHPVVGRSMIGHALHAAAGTHPDHLLRLSVTSANSSLLKSCAITPM